MISRDNVMTNPRLAGLVRRYHTWPITKEQTVAEHTWQVMRIYLALFPDKMPHEVWVYLLQHDAGEIKSGDAPYPVKVKYPGLRPIHDQIEEDSIREQGLYTVEITSEHRILMKICDMIEMWEFGLEERSRGNQFMDMVIEDCYQWVQESSIKIGVWSFVCQYMDKMQEKLCGS